MPDSNERLRILSDREIKEIFGFPRFTHEDRMKYFSLSERERHTFETELRSVRSKAHCILQFGYFKAQQIFFSSDTYQGIEEDLAYVLRQYFPDNSSKEVIIPDPRTRKKHQQIILKLCQFKRCGKKDKKVLREKACQAARVSSKPHYVFRILMDLIANMKIDLPGYRWFQDTVSQALTQERRRLGQVLNQHIELSELEVLEALLKSTDQLYEITQLRREPKNYTFGQIKEEVERTRKMKPLYHLAQRVLPLLSLSNESIKYYASLVGYYSVYKLNRLNTRDSRLYLLCFVYHRYQQAHDNLISSLIYQVRHFLAAAKEASRECLIDHRMKANENLQKAGRILEFFTNDTISEDAPFYQVKQQAFAILERDKMQETAEYIANEATVDEALFHWQQVDKLAGQFKRRLRPILLAVTFEAASPNHPVIAALLFLKEVFLKGKPLSQVAFEQFPMEAIAKKSRPYLYTKMEDGRKRILPNRYEFIIYRLLRDRLEAGGIFCRSSVRFRSFEDDLIDDRAWKNKNKLIADSGLRILHKSVKQHLDELKDQLETRIGQVNARIHSGENEHFKITGRGDSPRWALQYPRQNDPANHTFFDALPQVDISRVTHFVHQQCGFMEAFEHVLGRYGKTTVDTRLLTACLIAWATNMGLGKMGSISDISYQVLAAISENFIRLETLKAANDRISNATSTLSIFRHYDINEVVHSSSDGQKFETRIHTLLSRYSSKYFGLKKGLSSYTLTANHVPVNATIFGANEHESHYVFDLLYNNTTDIQPSIHSTDTHGTNQVNFAILHFFGHQFAPRYANIYETVSKSLYAFRHPNQYEDGQLRPVRKIRERLIIDEWENIQRIIVSLACKATTQSIIISKLSAHARKNKTKQALWEYDNIIRSLYLLDYVDSPPLRRHIQKALNRTESYHKLRRAIAIANGGKLRFRTQTEQEIWNECSRLIANCIIHYNAAILSNMLDQYENTTDTVNTEWIKQISPVAWQHVNLYGRYEFQKTPDPINLEDMISQLSHLNPTP